MRQQTSIKLISDFIKELSDFKDYKVLPTNDGASTDVYKLTSNSVNLYLRLSDPDENMSTEVLAHNLVLKLGVSVPEVVAYEDFNPILHRSYMITTEIKGNPVNKNQHSLKNILIDAGKQLALINSVPVENFGWLDWKTPNTKKLVGKDTSWDEFALNFDYINDLVRELKQKEILSKEQADKYVPYIINNKDLVECNQAYLAHGDFGYSHIYSSGNHYSGIIDFGDINANCIYNDLSHFYTYHPEGFDDLLKGYLEVTDLEDGYLKKIEFIAMLNVVRKLLWVARYLPDNLDRKRSDYVLLSRVLDSN